MKAIKGTITSVSFQQMVRMLNRKPTQLHEHHSEYGSIEVMSGTFNLVLSRDIRENSHIAAEIAVEIAQKNAGRDVWYLNTYSGEELLTSSFDRAFGGAQLSERSSLPNLRAVDIPMGQWDTSVIAKKIEEDGRDNAPPVLVLNSFEHSELSRGARQRIAMELVRLRQQYRATIIVFSHEMKRDIHPGYSGRGAMGLLATCSERVARLSDKYENQIAQKKLENGDVHEKQTQLTEIEVTPAVVDVDAVTGDVGRGRPTYAGEGAQISVRPERNETMNNVAERHEAPMSRAQRREMERRASKEARKAAVVERWEQAVV